MSKLSLLDVIQELAVTFEERVLDQNCADNNMKWDVYITKILDGWVPDNFPRTHALECYLVAIKKLSRSGRTTTGSSMAIRSS